MLKIKQCSRIADRCVDVEVLAGTRNVDNLASVATMILRRRGVMMDDDGIRIRAGDG